MPVDTVTDRTALAAIASPGGKVAYLGEEGRQGLFAFKPGNYAARIAADSLQGLYVASTLVASSAGCWVRHWDGVNGRPEWFGAQVNNGAFNNLPALDACVALCPVTLLQLADYWIPDTWVINTSYRRVEGQGVQSYDTYQGTRILLPDGSKTVMRVGPASAPGGNPAVTYLRHVEVSGVNLTRVAAVVPTANAELLPTAMRVNYVYECRFSNIAGWESAIGFSIHGAVTTKFDDCIAFRSAAGTTPVNDMFFGFYCIGNPPVIAGGNASLYLNRCLASLGGTPPLSFSSGFRLTGAFVDTFLTQPETLACHRGISVVGTGSTGAPGSNIDLHISHAIIDQSLDFGLSLEDLAPGSLIEISHPYVSMPASGFAGIYFRAGGGNVSLIGGQVIGTSGGVTIGLFVEQQGGVDAIDLKIHNCPRPVIIDGSSNFRIEPAINNPGTSGSNSAIWVVGSTRGEINASVKGKANAFNQGVYFSGAAGGNSRVDVRCTRIDPACIIGGSGNKLVNVSTQVTATGLFGASHLASGIMT